MFLRNLIVFLLLAKFRTERVNIYIEREYINLVKLPDMRKRLSPSLFKRIRRC